MNDLKQAFRSAPATKHARQRMDARRLSFDAVDAAMEYGRVVFVRGAAIYALGRKEVERLERSGVTLAAYEGIQVVCSQDGAIVTAYRNSDFRGLKPRNRPRRRAA